MVEFAKANIRRQTSVLDTGLARRLYRDMFVFQPLGEQYSSDHRPQNSCSPTIFREYNASENARAAPILAPFRSFIGPISQPPSKLAPASSGSYWQSSSRTSQISISRARFMNRDGKQFSAEFGILSQCMYEATPPTRRAPMRKS